jgi:2-C-methyl-D-erythritol 2,4-cyclodiphosphate synthase
MLATVRDAVTALGWQVGNIDCIVFLQRPKILPHRQAILQRMAEILRMEPEQIGLQAKTGEHVGPVGREEAIVAQCVALLVKREQIP